MAKEAVNKDESAKTVVKVEDLEKEIPEKTVDSGVKIKEKPEIRTVTLDNTEEMVVKLIQQGIQLDFDPTSFRHLSDEVLDMLDRQSLQRYFVAKGVLLERERRERVIDDPNYLEKLYEDPFSNTAELDIEQINDYKRPGWHVGWQSPRDVESRKRQGWRNIRQLSAKQKKAIEEGKAKREDFLGEENGETLKIGREDKPELVAMECPMELHEQHIRAVHYKSSGRYKKNKEEFLEKMARLKVEAKDLEGEVRQ